MQFIANIHNKGNLVARASVMDSDEARPDEIACEGMRQLKRDGERNSMTLERPKTDEEKTLAADFDAGVKAFGRFIVDAMDDRVSKSATGTVAKGSASLRSGEWRFQGEEQTMVVRLQALSDEDVEARERQIDEILGRGKAA